MGGVVLSINLRSILLFLAVEAMASDSKLTSDLRWVLDHANSSEPLPVIVQYRDSATPLYSRHGGVALGGGGLATRLAKRDVAELVADPAVQSVTLDHVVEAQLDYGTAAAGGTIAQGSGWTGRGIGVAVIDSGIADHDDLKDSACSNTRVRHRRNFVQGDSTVDDKFGHGTHVAGIIAGNGICTLKDKPRSTSGAWLQRRI